MQKPKHDLESFVQVWHDLQFSHIHFSCLDSASRPSLMQALNDIILGKDVHNKVISLTLLMIVI